MKGFRMKKNKRKIEKSGFGFALMLVCFMLFGMPVRAQGEETIKPGIFAGEIDLSGMTEEQAKAAVEAYVEGLRDTEIVLQYSSDASVTVTAGELGIAWANTEIVTEAVEIGTQGNVIERYKVLKDLEHENKVYPIELYFNIQEISNILTQKCAG